VAVAPPALGQGVLPFRFVGREGLRHSKGVLADEAVSMGETLALTGAILGHANPRGDLCPRPERPVAAR
jgi:hypothetical protein